MSTEQQTPCLTRSQPQQVGRGVKLAQLVCSPGLPQRPCAAEGLLIHPPTPPLHADRHLHPFLALSNPLSLEFPPNGDLKAGIYPLILQTLVFVPTMCRVQKQLPGRYPAHTLAPNTP